MVRLTSVSPLLYASPNISRQTASLNNKASDMMQPRLYRWMPAASTGDSHCLKGDRDDGTCAMAMMTPVMT